MFISLFRGLLGNGRVNSYMFDNSHREDSGATKADQHKRV